VLSGVGAVVAAVLLEEVAEEPAQSMVVKESRRRGVLRQARPEVGRLRMNTKNCNDATNLGSSFTTVYNEHITSFTVCQSVHMALFTGCSLGCRLDHSLRSVAYAYQSHLNRYYSIYASRETIFVHSNRLGQLRPPEGGAECG
jgi:hypothetical protein